MLSKKRRGQSLEFVVETRILVEMKIENHEKKISSMGKNIDKHTFFYEN